MKKQLRIISILILFTGTFLILKINNYRMPGNQQGYQPQQPIDFSHRLHAGELTIACLYCHYGAEKSRHAGIPATNICMNCHRYVIASIDNIRLEEVRAKKENRKPRQIVSQEIEKIYATLGLNIQLEEIPDAKKEPIRWTKIHNVPDYVYFSHEPHVAAGVDCVDCHGDVRTMDQVRQVNDLGMGWCLKCHRDSQNIRDIVPERTQLLSDCATCHY
jgi:formate-dependent nitrite reductase cytochrome c552 subunit